MMLIQLGLGLGIWPIIANRLIALQSTSMNYPYRIWYTDTDTIYTGIHVAPSGELILNIVVVQIFR